VHETRPAGGRGVVVVCGCVKGSWARPAPVPVVEFTNTYCFDMPHQSRASEAAHRSLSSNRIARARDPPFRGARPTQRPKRKTRSSRRRRHRRAAARAIVLSRARLLRPRRVAVCAMPCGATTPRDVLMAVLLRAARDHALLPRRGARHARRERRRRRRRWPAVGRRARARVLPRGPS